MTSDELRALADAWGDCSVGLLMRGDGECQPGVLARLLADAMEWIEGVGQMLVTVEGESGLTGSAATLLARFAALKEETTDD